MFEMRWFSSPPAGAPKTLSLSVLVKQTPHHARAHVSIVRFSNSLTFASSTLNDRHQKEGLGEFILESSSGARA